MKIKSITEDTLVPLSLLGFIAAGAFAMSSYSSKIEHQGVELTELKRHQEELASIPTDIAVIKERLEELSRYIHREDRRR